MAEAIPTPRSKSKNLRQTIEIDHERCQYTKTAHKYKTVSLNGGTENWAKAQKLYLRDPRTSNLSKIKPSLDNKIDLMNNRTNQRNLHTAVANIHQLYENDSKMQYKDSFL